MKTNNTTPTPETKSWALHYSNSQGVEAFWGQDQWYYKPEGEEDETDF